jgi:hypothetical protein
MIRRLLYGWAPTDGWGSETAGDFTYVRRVRIALLAKHRDEYLRLKDVFEDGWSPVSMDTVFAQLDEDTHEAS